MLLLEREKVWEYSSGLMALFMKDTGDIIRQMEKEDLFMVIEMFILEIGKMIKLMALANLSMMMVQHSMDNGSKTRDMEKVEKSGLMAHTLKVNTLMVKRKVKDFSNGQMDPRILENS